MINNKRKNILNQVPSQKQIKRKLRKIIFGEFLFCPKCGTRQVKPSDSRYWCRLCRRHFSLTSNTWLKGIKMPWENFWLLLWCWTKEISLKQTMDVCGLSKPTIRDWYAKFRKHLPHDKLDEVLLSGTVQMDEAYRGGKKRGYSLIGAKEKTIEGKTSKIAIKVIEKSSVDRRDALAFIWQHIVPQSQLHTDGSSIYRGIQKWWPLDHTYEIHSKFEFTLTSEIEGLWGDLTTFIRRVYNHVTRPHITSVIREFSARRTYAEWFEYPDHFLEIAHLKLTRPVRQEWRGQYQKTRSKKYKSKTTINSIPIVVTRLSTVPRC